MLLGREPYKRVLVITTNKGALRYNAPYNLPLIITEVKKIKGVKILGISITEHYEFNEEGI